MYRVIVCEHSFVFLYNIHILLWGRAGSSKHRSWRRSLCGDSYLTISFFIHKHICNRHVNKIKKTKTKMHETAVRCKTVTHLTSVRLSSMMKWHVHLNQIYYRIVYQAVFY